MILIILNQIYYRHITVGKQTADVKCAVLIPNTRIATQLFCISFSHGRRLFVDQTSDREIHLLCEIWKYLSREAQLILLKSESPATAILV